MEYVGRRVKKERQGGETSFGLVQAYDSGTGVFRIVYDGGDLEELKLAEVSSLLLSTENPPPPPPPSAAPVRKRGRPKKRRRIVNKGTDNGNLEIESGAGSGGLDLNLNDGLDLNVDAINTISSNDGGVNGAGAGGNMCDLDLNEDVNLDLNEKLCLNNDDVVVGNLEEKKEFIDLNLDASEDCEKMTDGREGRCFDLNLQLTEDEVGNSEECELLKGPNESVIAEGNTQMSEGLSEHDIGENLVNVDGRNCVVNMENREDSSMTNYASGVVNGNVATQKKKRGRKRKDPLINNNIDVSDPEPQNGNIKPELDSVEGTPLKTGDELIACENGLSGAVTRGRIGRKRSELSENIVNLSTPATGLRRSSRRSKREALSELDQISNAADLDDIDQKFSSPVISFMPQEEKMAKSRRKSFCPAILPTKVELPRSSCNLDLCGVPLVDLISVYAFLRSFSTLLFLSPFELDDFVVSIKCNDSTLLFDSIHVSLLRALRKHLESLSNEGSESAANCIRSLNWDLLDLITWPMFAVEYLLLHNPGYIPLDRCHLKVLLNDYYKLSVSAKIEILRHLCDDVIEVEAFRSELNRRTSATEYPTDLARDMRFESTRKRKPAMDVASTSCITEDGGEEPADWNNDECCLCKMDGNLICCDGCPAAFHSRCVGVTSSLLPEGDWYCPECAIEKDRPWMKVGKSIRGAEILGSDLYGRIFYSSCGYLLVLESLSEEYSFTCYSRNDLPVLIEALESTPFIYDSIIIAICKHWNLVRGVGRAKNEVDSRSVQLTSPEKGQLQNISLSPSEILNKNESFAEKTFDEKSMVSIGITNSCNTELDNAENGIAMLETGEDELKVENHVASSEGSNEISQTITKTLALNENGPPDSSNRERECLNDCHIPGQLVDGGDHHMILTSGNVEKEKTFGSENHSYEPESINSGVLSLVHCQTNYDNRYDLARTASSYYDEFTSKSSDKTSEAAPKTVEEIIAGQVKVVSNRLAEFSWSNSKNSNVQFRKERCGWCFFCRFPDDEKNCLFIMNDAIPAVENFTCEILGVQSMNRKNHTLDIACHIICLENHLQGLLLGPWSNPNYSMTWRKSVLGVNDLASLKKLLLTLESNLHHLAISADWRKHVDSVNTMGSAAHIICSSSRASSKHGTGKKKVKSAEVGTTPSSNAAPGLSLYWWRGGYSSRMLFRWKVLPRTLVSKAARQGGGKKIPGVLYPEIGEYAKRTKSACWRAAVETSTSVEQLALQIRELEMNIRWDDIGKSSLISKIEKDVKKPVKSFKKVIIRRKSSEGSVVRYLMDFGKRRFIPDVVVKHGTMLEDFSNERKRYWLEESHVPLHLLKTFEEKRIARKSNKMNSGKLHESTGVMRRPAKKKGFDYLFSKVERSENYQCGHCKKDVLIREAVSCQHCKGFFHRRHVQISVGSTISACAYTCHNCQDGQSVKVDGRKVKSQSQILKNTSQRLKSIRSRKGRKMGKVKRKVKSKSAKGVPLVVPLRRSARNAARVAKLSLQSAKVKKRKKRKQPKSEKGSYKKPKISSCKKRTPVSSSYWLNGLHVSRRPNDERLMHFRSRMLLVLSGEITSVLDKPKCILCGEREHKSDTTYVACEICGVWLHFDALSPTAAEIENVIGFKCHLCLQKRPPLCPHPCTIENFKDDLITEKNTDTECARENSNHLADPSDGSACPKSPSDTEIQG